MYQLYNCCLNCLVKIEDLYIKFILKEVLNLSYIKIINIKSLQIKMQQQQNSGNNPTLLLFLAKSYFSLFLLYYPLFITQM